MKVHEIIQEQVGTAIAINAGIEILKTVAKRAANLGPLNDLVNSKLARIPAVVMRLVKYNEFYKVAETWLAKRKVLDDMLAKKEISPEGHDYAQRQIAEEMITTILATQLFQSILSWVISAVTYNKIKTLGPFLRTSIAVGAMALTQVATVKVVEWLQTEKGKRAVAVAVLYAIDPTVTWLWSLGPAKIWGELQKPTPDGAAAVKQVHSVTPPKPPTDAEKQLARLPNPDTTGNKIPPGYTRGLNAAGNLAPKGGSDAVNAILSQQR